MLALTAPRIAWRRHRLTRAQCLRGCVAGAAWGLALTAGLTAMTAWSCGGVCLPEVVENTVLSVAAGILGIGPVVAYARR
jgi:hypothetical protein